MEVETSVTAHLSKTTSWLHMGGGGAGSSHGLTIFIDDTRSVHRIRRALSELERLINKMNTPEYRGTIAPEEEEQEEEDRYSPGHPDNFGDR